MRLDIRCGTALVALGCAAALLQACGEGAPSTAGAQHVRGTVKGVDGDVVTIATSGGSVSVELTESTQFATLVPSDPDHIRPGSFVGVTSVDQPDGSQRAVEVHVFPESMRGTGEGSYGWDLPGSSSAPSRMTNGTVAPSRMTNGTVAEHEAGAALTVAYKDGSQTIELPPGVPVVSIEPGDRGDVKPGAHVFIIAHRLAGGALAADRVMAGRDGVVPPM